MTNLAWQWDVAGAAGARPEGRIDEGTTYTPGSGHVGLAGAAGDGQVDLSWTAPDDCGSHHPL